MFQVFCLPDEIRGLNEALGNNEPAFVEKSSFYFFDDYDVR